MALRIRELPWYLQTLIYFAVAVAVFAAGEMLPQSPVKQKSDVLDQKKEELQRLRGEVAVLQQVQARHREFKGRVEASEQQLAASKAVVPDEKNTDEFMRALQGAAVNSRVSLRRLTAKPVVFQQFYAEMPVEVELDGAYYSLLEFFDRLSRLSRIVNAGELELESLEARTRGGQRRYEYAPGASVAGTCVLTTYYTPTEAELAAAAPPTPAARGARVPAPRPPAR